MASDHDTAARIELERHKPGMSYAERQQMKRGEYEAVAQGILRRAKLQATVLVTLAVVVWCMDGLSRTRSSGVFVIMAVISYVQYSHARRTAETIRALASSGEPTDRPDGS